MSEADHYEMGLRLEIARHRGELYSHYAGERDAGWADWAESLLNARARVAELEADAARLREENRRLGEKLQHESAVAKGRLNALLNYGRHHADCAQPMRGLRCNCGLDGWMNERPRGPAVREGEKR